MSNQTCTGCGSKLVGNHAVRNGERFCPRCVEFPAGEAEQKIRSGDVVVEPSYPVVLDVRSLMERGDPR